MRHMHQVKGANPFTLTIFLSLWCSPDNMPAFHAGDHRSEAGQGRHFLCPQSIWSDALLWNERALELFSIAAGSRSLLFANQFKGIEPRLAGAGAQFADA